MTSGKSALLEKYDTLMPDGTLGWLLHVCATGNDVHESAKNLSIQFEAYYKQHYSRSSAPAARKSASPAPGTASPAPAARAQVGSKAHNSDMERMQRKMEEMQRELDSVQNKSGGGGKSGGGTAKKKTGGGTPARRNMTFEEKRKLSLDIGKLSHDKLGKVVEIIKKRKKVADDEEIEIDIDSLGESTLRELEKYAAECLNPTKPVTLPCVFFCLCVSWVSAVLGFRMQAVGCRRW